MPLMNALAQLWQHTREAAQRRARRRAARNASRYMPSGLNSSGLSRIEVRPPSLRHAPVPLLQRLLFWLIAPAPQEASPPLNRLPGVQHEFRLAITDIDCEAADLLLHRISRARSLRELWHMRLDVYNLVATHSSEFEATQRVAQLNRHFPQRAPRMVGALA
jgi:hypothetical protein